MTEYEAPYFGLVIIFRTRHIMVLTATLVMQVTIFPFRSSYISKVALSVEDSEVNRDKMHHTPHFGF